MVVDRGHSSFSDGSVVLGDTQMMNFFASIGGIMVANAAFRALRWFWKTRNWKPTPWLMQRSTMRS
jgi:hypothetical protein